MEDVIFTVKLTLDRVEIQNDADLGALAVYFLATVGGHASGRSATRRSSGPTTLALGGNAWTWEFVRGRNDGAIAVEVRAWDEDLVVPGGLGAITGSVAAPWLPWTGTTDSDDGRYRLAWHVEVTAINLAPTDAALVFRQPLGGALFSTLALPDAVAVQITHIDGLCKPGVDDRPNPAPGTTRNAGAVAGYTSEDDLGRVYVNRLPDGTWKKSTQYIELTARVFSDSALLRADDKIVWSIEDPDDPVNEDPRMRADAGRLLDPNDYQGDDKSAPAGDDNDAYGTGNAKPGFAEIAPFTLAGSETAVDPVTRTSRVRFDYSDVAGDNFRIRATFKTRDGIARAVPFATGVITVWNRIDIEYVEMPSAKPLPVNEIARHFEPARVQFDVGSWTKLTSPGDDIDAMGDDYDAAHVACEKYCTKASGKFTHEGTPGWFFVASVNKFRRIGHAQTVFKGWATTHGNAIVLDERPDPGAPPCYFVRVFDPPLAGEMPPPRKSVHDTYLMLMAGPMHANTVAVAPHQYFTPDNPDTPFATLDLAGLGYPDGTRIQVQGISLGLEVEYGGISPGGADACGKHYFGGKLIVFSETSEDYIFTLCHELCHSLDNAHMCGNWDWQNGPHRTSCCMNYFFMPVLGDAPPPPPPSPADTPWTYTVQPDDYPVRIAEKLTGDANRFPELVAANCPPKERSGVGFASQVPGEKLRLPDSWIPLVNTAPPPTHVEGPGVAPPDTQWIYVVESGDYPVKIAEKLTGDANRFPELVDANCPPKQRSGGSFASLYPGERLVVPASWNSSIATRSHPTNLLPSKTRPPVPHTMGLQSPEMCGPHLRRIRGNRLETNPGLGWK